MSKTNQSSRKDRNPSENQPITKFQGYYNFLSNDFPSWVYYEGIIFPSVNTAFQAARTDDGEIRKRLSTIQDVEEFRNLAMSIKNPDDWNQRKLKVMEILLRDKFKRNKDLQAKLMGTKQKKLINTMKRSGYNQLYWGVFEGQGNNLLGKLLMDIREQFSKGKDTQKWIQQNLSLEKDENLLAKVQFIVIKDGKKIDKLFCDKKKNNYIFGSVKTIDFQLQNPTISRNHACICFTNQLQIIIVDLNSTHGTFLRRKDSKQIEKLQPLIGYRLNKEDQIKFGTSARQYSIDIDRSQVQKYMEESQRALKNQLDEGIDKINEDNFDQMDEETIRKALGYGKKCLLLDKIPQSVSYHSLKSEFQKFGKLQKLRMALDRKTGNFEGMAVVYYSDPQTIQEIMRKYKEFAYQMKIISEEIAEQILNPSRKKNYGKYERREKDNSKRRDRRDSPGRYRQKERDRSRSRQKSKKY